MLTLTKEDILEETARRKEFIKQDSLDKEREVVQTIGQAKYLDIHGFFDKMSLYELYTNGWTQIVILIPFDDDTFNEIYSYLISLGYEPKGESQIRIKKNVGIKEQGFRHPDFSALGGIEIKAQTNREGSQCQIVQVGVEEVPVYRMECKE